MSGEKKVILVTGGTGLVGKALEALVSERPNSNENWVFVGSKDADLRNKQSTEALFEKYKPTHVLHLAGSVGSVLHQINNNLEYLRYNLHINDNVLQTAHERDISKVVSCLSTCIFPDKTSYPIDETMMFDGPPHVANYGYGYAKRLIDVANRAYHQQHGRIYTSVVLCNVFGPHDNFNPTMSHVVPGLMQRLYEVIKDGNTEDKEFRVMGSGKALRQFIYSKDVAQLMLWVLREYNSVEPIILSVDESQELSIAQLAETLAKAFDFKGKIVFDESVSDGQLKKTATNAKLRSLLPDFEFTPFEEAINETVKWYQNNHDLARHEMGTMM